MEELGKLASSLRSLLLSEGRGDGVLLIVNAIVLLFLFVHKNFLKMIFISLLILIPFSVTLSTIKGDSALSEMLVSGVYRTFGYIYGSNVDMEQSGRDWVYDAIIDKI